MVGELGLGRKVWNKKEREARQRPFFPYLGLLKIWAGSFFEVEVVGGSDSKESACDGSPGFHP